MRGWYAASLRSNGVVVGVPAGDGRYIGQKGMLEDDGKYSTSFEICACTVRSNARFGKNGRTAAKNCGVRRSDSTLVKGRQSGQKEQHTNGTSRF